jgi:hypothetical protein
MVQGFEMILEKLQKYSADSYTFEQAYCKFWITEMKVALKLINNTKALE